MWIYHKFSFPVQENNSHQFPPFPPFLEWFSLKWHCFWIPSPGLSILATAVRGGGAQRRSPQCVCLCVWIACNFRIPAYKRLLLLYGRNKNTSEYPLCIKIVIKGFINNIFGLYILYFWNIFINVIRFSVWFSLSFLTKQSHNLC